MFSFEQSDRLPTDWPEAPSLQMGQLIGVAHQRQPADRFDHSDGYLADRHGIDRETQFADPMAPEIQALG